jgi:translation initiation factor eIF-2B subunit epsilon
MPPKGKKSESQKEEEQREPLQAVLLTDSYENRFAPFTLEKPRV